MTETFDPYRKWLGIPPEEQPPDFYRLLGIPRFEGDPDVIENAAHRQMAYIRTFQSGRHAAESQKLLNELAAAKVCLLTAAKKEQYDANLRQQVPVELQPIPVAADESGEDADNSLLRFPSETNSVSSRRNRKSAHSNTTLVLAPILSTLGAIVVIIMLVLIYTSRQRKPNQGPKRKSAESSTASAVEKFKSSDDSPIVKKSAGETKANVAASSKDSGEAPPAGTGKSQPNSPTETIADAANNAGPKAKPSLVEREQRLLQQLDAIRADLSRREMSRSRNQLAASGRAMRVGRVKDEVEQTQVLAQYLDEFWSHAQRGLKKAQDVLVPPPPKSKDAAKPAAEKPASEKPASEKPAAGADAKPDQDPAKAPASDAKPAAKPDEPPPPSDSVEVTLFQHKLVVVKVDGDELTYRAGDTTKTARLRELPSLDAAALAYYSLKGDDLFGRVYVAAFLCVDSQGDRAENHRVAKVLFDELSQSASAPFPFLEREIQRALGNASPPTSP